MSAQSTSAFRGRRKRRYRRRSSNTKTVETTLSCWDENEPDDEDEPEDMSSMNESFSGGYDFDFIEEPPEELNCSICLLVLRDPHLTSCCGSHFCQACINKIKDRTQPCPLCKDATFTTFLNKSFQRKVNELKIHCPQSELGCNWIGTVAGAANHLDPSSGDCQYVHVVCSLCKEEVQRKDLINHMSEECPKRPFTCPHCSYSNTWIEIATTHSKQCMSYPLQCPNQCGIGAIERKNLKIHITSLCPLQVQPCAFEFAGCAVQVKRKDGEEHIESSMASHVTLLAGVCADYKIKLESKEKEIGTLQSAVTSLKETVKSHESLILSLNHKLSQLQVSQQGIGQRGPSPNALVFPPVDFYLTQFSFLKQTNKKWTSKPFYTHPGGYKMCLNVHANGIGKGRNSHVSVFANLMNGIYDSELPWPFQGDVIVNLHLSTSDDVVKVLVFGPKSPAKATQKVTEGDMNEFGQGDAQFVNFSKISSESFLHFVVHRVNWKPSN